MENLFDPDGTKATVTRINQLAPDTPRLWGKMNAAQMLAHCCFAYQYAFDANNAPRPNALVRWFIRQVATDTVAGDKPYKKNMKTVSAFVVSDERDFDRERRRLIGYIEKVRDAGTWFFEGRDHFLFGTFDAAQ